MTFEDFKKLAAERGLQARSLDKGRHWQIAGTLCTVNYWPGMGTIHIKGDADKVPGRFHSPMKAIGIAVGEPTPQQRAVREKTKARSGASLDELRAKLRSATRVAVMWRHAYHGAVAELDAKK